MANNECRPEQETARSVARDRPPAQQILFPGVKLDLAVILLLLVCLWFAVSISGLDHMAALSVLLLGSCSGALWLVWRIRRALRAAERGLQQKREDFDGA